MWWLMPYLEGTPCFQNWEPKFLDLITFQKCKFKIMSFLLFMLSVWKDLKEGSM